MGREEGVGCVGGFRGIGRGRYGVDWGLAGNDGGAGETGAGGHVIGFFLERFLVSVNAVAEIAIGPKTATSQISVEGFGINLFCTCGRSCAGGVRGRRRERGEEFLCDGGSEIVLGQEEIVWA